MSNHEVDCVSKGDQLVPVEQALRELLDAATPVDVVQTLPLVDCLGRVLAGTLVSAVDVPPADNSAMDGYAVRSAELASDGGTCLPVSQRIMAGATGTPLAAGTVARIFTGAPIPPGADAVVMQEQVSQRDGQACFDRGAPVGAHIRRAGEDIRAGAAVLQAGTRLRAQELGLAASIGAGHLSVFRRVRVGVFFTGDELVEPGTNLAPGQIYNSNRYTMRGLLQALGCEIVDLGTLEDTLPATQDALHTAAAGADLVLSSGGVSVGEADHVRVALEQMGELRMWRIAMKPGKPVAFGFVDGTPFLGLPGNPVSVFATFQLLAAPFIRRLQGITGSPVEPLSMPAGFDWPRAGSRREYLRARLERDTRGQLEVTIYPNQGSGVLTSTCWADGLAVVPAGRVVHRGDPVDYLPFSELL